MTEFDKLCYYFQFYDNSNFCDFYIFNFKTELDYFYRSLDDFHYIDSSIKVKDGYSVSIDLDNPTFQFQYNYFNLLRGNFNFSWWKTDNFCIGILDQHVNRKNFYVIPNVYMKFLNKRLRQIIIKDAGAYLSDNFSDDSVQNIVIRLKNAKIRIDKNFFKILKTFYFDRPKFDSMFDSMFSSILKNGFNLSISK